MTWYLLDTNHLSAAIRPVSALRERLRLARRSGHVFGVFVPVLCELEAGIAQLADSEAARQRLRSLMSQVRTWPMDSNIAIEYGRLFLELRQAGRALSQVDIILAAVCRHMGVTLLTADRDFGSIPDLHTEDWLAGP